MTKKRKKKVGRYANLLSLHEDPTIAGSLGGVTRFAKARTLPVAKVREKLEADLGYTLHKPTRRRFRTLPVLVFAIDDQWAADLIDVGNIAKSNRGTVICFPWWTCCPSTRGWNPSRPRPARTSRQRSKKS